MINHTTFQYSRVIKKHAFETINNIIGVLEEPMNVKVLQEMFPQMVE